jgi:hypothetical protein
MMAKAMKMMMGGVGSSGGASCGCGCGTEERKERDAFSPQIMMMMDIMPNKLERMLPLIPAEERSEFVLRMLSILIKKGCEGMSDKEKEELFKKACGV